MRKAIKKIATVVASVSMVAAMGISAFAADTYQFVGNPNLVGEADPGSTAVGWVTVAESQFMEPVDGLDGVLSYTGNFVHANDYDNLDDETKDGYREFKILADGADFGWNFQMCLGNPEAAWADNQSQFRVTDALEEGEFTAYVDPELGLVCIIQNQKNVNLLVRYHSRDEDSWNFVKTTKADIVADGYSEGDVYFDDTTYLEFINKCLAHEGGEAITTLYEGEDTTTPDDNNTTVDDNNGGEDTTDAAEEGTAAASRSTNNDDKDDDGLSGGAIAGIVVAVVAVVAVIVALVKKKK